MDNPGKGIKFSDSTCFSFLTSILFSAFFAASWPRENCRSDLCREHREVTKFFRVEPGSWNIKENSTGCVASLYLASPFPMVALPRCLVPAHPSYTTSLALPRSDSSAGSHTARRPLTLPFLVTCCRDRLSS